MATLLYSTNISFNNVDVITRLNRPGIAKWLIRAAKLEGYDIEGLNYNFCSDNYLLEINRQYLSHDYFTDIITFDLSDSLDSIAGDIYISTERVRENGITNKCVYNEELRRVMVHGLLHLCGYKDKSSKDIRLMRGKEDEYLALYNKMFHVK